jgi:hypothetical protein
VGTALYRAPEQESAIGSEMIQGVKKTTSTVNGVRTAYNTKADLFSVGIILFEMCHRPFTTGMERVQSLLALRKNSIEFLKTVNHIPENLKNLIGSLVQTDPSKRPEALELQSSPLMPPRIQLDKSYLDEVLAAITVPHSDASRRVVNTLFQRKDKFLAEHEDISYDQELHSSILKSLKMDGSAEIKENSVGKRSKKDELPILLPMEVQESFRKLAESVFLSHGASKFNPSILMPRSSYSIADDGEPSNGIILHTSKSSWSESQKRHEIFSTDNTLNTVTQQRPVELMSRTGTILSLPMELVTPYARAVAHLGFNNVTRYHIDHVFSETVGGVNGNTPGDTHPSLSTEAVYDVIREDFSIKFSPSTQQFEALPLSTRSLISERRGAVEAEVITTAVEVIDRIDPKRLIGQRFLRIGDSRLGNAILDLCAAPHPRFKALSALSTICDEALSQRWKSPPLPDSFQHACFLLHDIGLPLEVQRALKPFIKVLTSISNPRAVLAALHNVLLLLLPAPPLHYPVTSLFLSLPLVLSQTFYSHEVIVAIQKAAMAAKDQKTPQYQARNSKMPFSKKNNPPKDKDNLEEKRKDNEQKLQAHLTIESKRFVCLSPPHSHKDPDTVLSFENLMKPSVQLNQF